MKRIIIILVIGIIAAFFLIKSGYLGSQAQSNSLPKFTHLELEEYSAERKTMVDTQLRTRDITDEKVLDAMGKVPRHEFVPPQSLSLAYKDHPVPIGYGQTISQPYIVALMTQSLDLKPDSRVLEIGTGSGYQAAVLAELVDEVYTIEIVDELAQSAYERLEKMGYENIEVRNADGYSGWEKYAPFDAIIITAAANHIPPPLLQQLKDGGKLIVPLGPTLRFQTLTLVTKNNDVLDTEFITGVRFVPMIGKSQQPLI